MPIARAAGLFCVATILAGCVGFDPNRHVEFFNSIEPSRHLIEDKNFPLEESAEIFAFGQESLCRIDAVNGVPIRGFFVNDNAFARVEPGPKRLDVMYQQGGVVVSGEVSGTVTMQIDAKPRHTYLCRYELYEWDGKRAVKFAIEEHPPSVSRGCLVAFGMSPIGAAHPEFQACIARQPQP